MPKSYHTPIVEDTYYHIYNRGNAGAILFYKEKNYSYFLKQYQKYISPLLDTFAYCLLPNHFHFLARVKDELDLSNIKNLALHISEHFRRLFITYAQAINKQENRSGSLFQKPFKRIPVEREAHLLSLVSYIHMNPSKHRISKNFKQYPFSSYQSILSTNTTNLQRKIVLDWFGSKEAYIRFHEEMKSVHLDASIKIED